METKKSHNLLSINWRTRKVSSVINLGLKACEPEGLRSNSQSEAKGLGTEWSLVSKGPRTVMPELGNLRTEKDRYTSSTERELMLLLLFCSSIQTLEGLDGACPQR